MAKLFELKKNKNFKLLGIIDINDRFRFFSDFFYKKVSKDFYNYLKKEIDNSKFNTIYEFLEPVLCVDLDGNFSIGFVVNEAKKQIFIGRLRRKKIQKLTNELNEKYKHLRQIDYNRYVKEYSKELNYRLNKFEEEVSERFSDKNLYKEALKLEFGIGERRRRFYLNTYNRVLRQDISLGVNKDIEHILFDYYMRLTTDKIRFYDINDYTKNSFEEFSKKILGF